MRVRSLFILGVLVLSVGCSEDSSETSSGAGGSSSGGTSAGGTSSGGSSSGGTSSGGSSSGGSNAGGTSSGGSSAGGANGGTSSGGTNAGGTSSGGTSSGGSSSGGSSSGGSSSGGSSGAVPTVGGCPVFSANDAWNTDISKAPASASWTQKLHTFVGNKNLHPDYGSYAGEVYGIPINVVPANQPTVPVSFDWYPEESDPGPYPFPGVDTVKIEGNSPTACDGDCHLLVVRQGECRLYEGYACEHQSDGWHCGNGATFDMTKSSQDQRPEGWTSADAAGLAIMPGLLRYDEVIAGEIRHAIRFTTSCTINKYVDPASHYAVPNNCNPNDPNAPPMGLRIRLQESFDISGFNPQVQVVLKAMKRYGMILADNGSNFYFQGEAHSGWTEEMVEPLKQIPASAFEAIEPGPLMP